MRKLLLVLLAMLIGVVTLELTACVGLRIESGRWQTWRSIDEQRFDLLGEAEEDGPPVAALRRARRLLRSYDHAAIHPYLGYVEDPARAGRWIASGSDSISVDLGFPANAANLLEPSTPDRTIVLVTGGSVAGLMASRAKTLEKQLGRLPRLAGREVRVVLAATGGFKQPQQLMALNYLLLFGAAPDLVINVDGFNEVALPPVDLIPRGIHPAYPRLWAHRVGALDPELRRTLGEVTYLQELREERARFFGGPLSYSMSAGLVWRALDRRLAARLSRAAARLRDRDLVLEGYQLRGPSFDQSSEEAVTGLMVDIWSRASLLMHQLCTARGIEYYHFLQPNQYVEGSKPLSSRERSVAWREDNPYRNGVVVGYPLLQAAGKRLRDQGVAFHDLTAIFEEVADTLYLDDCCHFNRRGEHIMAREIATAIGDRQRRARHPGGD